MKLLGLWTHLKLLATLWASLTRATRGSEEVWLTLTDVSQAIECVSAVTVEASNKCMLIINLSPAALNHSVRRFAVPVRECTLDVDPLALVPQTTLHLAALGHFQAVERVAVTPEEPGNEVVLAAELATSKVEFLPPILMVAVLETECLLVRSITFTRASTLAISKIIQCITSTITLDSCEQEVLLACRPAPFVHGASPV